MKNKAKQNKNRTCHTGWQSAQLVTEMVKVLAAQANNLSSIPGTPMVEGENQFPVL